MGEIAEYYMSFEYLEEQYKWEELEVRAADMEKDYMKGVLSWVPQDGNKILVQNMSDLHVSNCFAYMSARMPRNPVYSMWLHIFECELKKRK